MKFYIENQRVEKELDWVLAQLKLYMNGATTAQMEDRGIRYRQNYGVGMPHLKQLLKKIPYSYELAERLWFLEIRETMLLATLLVENDDMSLERCVEWAEKVNNKDLVERSAMFLWQRLNNIDDLIKDWLNGTDQELKACAFYTLGHRLKLDHAISYSIKDFVEHISEDGALVLQAASFALRMQMRKNPDQIPLLSNFIQRQQKSNRLIDQAMAQEILTEIDYLNS